MYSPHKHSYLQSRTQNINPRIINRSVNLARAQCTVDGCDFEPPYNRLTSEQPSIPIENVDLTRRPVAFGRWALPKLRKELHHPEIEVVLQAVTSIVDLVHDPERAYEAVKLRIPARLADLLIHDNPEIRERVCMALITFGGLYRGRDAIVKNKIILENLAKLFKDSEDSVRYKNALIIEMVARNCMAADDLIEFGFIPIILEHVLNENNIITAVYLDSMISLMYGEGKDKALEYGAFEIFIQLMEQEDVPVKFRAAYCLTIVSSTYKGKDLSYDAKILSRLSLLLNSDIKEIYTSAAAAIMFCTIKSRAKIRAGEIKHLPERLVALTNDWHNPPGQIFSIKALTNICEHPEIRYEVGEKYLDILENIIVGKSEAIQRYKEILIAVIKWVPWSNT